MIIMFVSCSRTYKTDYIVIRLSMITKLDYYFIIMSVDKHYIVIYAYILFKNIYKTAYIVIRLYMST